MKKQTTVAQEPVYFRHSELLRKRHGATMYRVPIDLQLGCPHRSVDGKGGCTFCPEDGAKARQIVDLSNIQEQVQRGVEFAKRRYGAKKFMVYFQAYTSTFAGLSRLKELYESVLAIHPFDAMTISTRPDCLSDSILDYFEELKESIDLWVELGVQTIHDKTLTHIQRDHDWACSEKAITRLNAKGVQVAIHAILGLPGEGMKEFRETFKYFSRLKLDGLKIHNLHVIKHTQLYEQFKAKPFKLYNEHEYAEILMELLPLLPHDLPLMRLVSDTRDDHLIAPRWTLGKSGFTEYFLKLMKAQGLYQGSAYNKEVVEIFDENSSYKPVFNDDKSFTFWDDDFKEHFHAKEGAETEALHKFTIPSGIQSLVNQQDVKLLDVCFGLGYNSLITAEHLHQNKSNYRLEVTALEMKKAIPFNSAKLFKDKKSELDWSECLNDLCRNNSHHNESFSVKMLWGDARYQVTKLDEDYFDVIYLDPFSSQRNSELWTYDFFCLLKRVIKHDGVLLTYSTAKPVLSGLVMAGFSVGETHSSKSNKGGTIASLDAGKIEYPIALESLELLHGTAKGLPYRDPQLILSNREILQHREQAVKAFSEKQVAVV